MSDATNPALDRLGELVTLDGHNGSSVTVALHGGHVVSWRTADGRERLFLSDRATIADGAAIRGGIPVCFPQFAGLGPLRKHGFARTSTWRCSGPCSFELLVEPGDWPGWPYRATLTLEVLLGPATLTTVLRVTNTGDDPFGFTGALHTYLACDAVGSVHVRGLDGRSLLDGGVVNGSIEFPDPAHDVDLSVLAPTGPVRVDGLAGPDGPSLVAAQTGFPDVVVWNVGSTLGAEMGDLGAGQWNDFVCVEAAVVGTPITVGPGATWIGTQTLSVT
ncbi:MAG: D-hexose-6-phosphate mutarotase [Ilumatobacteraceae bacterium]